MKRALYSQFSIMALVTRSITKSHLSFFCDMISPNTFKVCPCQWEATLFLLRVCKQSSSPHTSVLIGFLFFFFCICAKRVVDTRWESNWQHLLWGRRSKWPLTFLLRGFGIFASSGFWSMVIIPSCCDCDFIQLDFWLNLAKISIAQKVEECCFENREDLEPSAWVLEKFTESLVRALADTSPGA